MLSIRGLTKSFRAGIAGCAASVRVLDDIDLFVTAGEIVAIIGPAGTGKTTLLRCIAGILTPDRGQVQARHDRLVVLDAPSRTCHRSPGGGSDAALRRGVGRRTAVLVAGRDLHALAPGATRVLLLERGRLRAWPHTHEREAPTLVAEEPGPLTRLPGAPKIR